MLPSGMIPAGLQWCVAGGFAACPALAHDVDVWVYRATDIDYRRAALAADVADWCAENNRNRPIWPEKRYTFTAETVSSEFLAYEGLACRIEKVGIVTPPKAFSGGPYKPYHIMVTDAPDPGTLLQGFDVSTHAVAIDNDGRVWRHPGWTSPAETPVALLMNKHTPDRMKKICARFGHSIPSFPTGDELVDYGR